MGTTRGMFRLSSLAELSGFRSSHDPEAQVGHRFGDCSPGIGEYCERLDDHTLRDIGYTNVGASWTSRLQPTHDER